MPATCFSNLTQLLHLPRALVIVIVIVVDHDDDLVVRQED